jgi:endonuclease YncB( thermonuclease family)
MYEYHAIVDRVVDGDTIDVTIDLGFHTHIKTRVRLEGINAPESRTRDLEEKERGLAAKARLIEILEYNKNHCILRVSGLGKYGRALATVFVDSLSPLNGEDGITLVDVNKRLIEEGHAVGYDGGKR